MTDQGAHSLFILSKSALFHDADIVGDVYRICDSLQNGYELNCFTPNQIVGVYSWETPNPLIYALKKPATYQCWRREIINGYRMS